MTKIFVESEFAPLRKVVLAQSQFCYPTAEEATFDSSFLVAENEVLAQGQAGKDFAESYPEKQKQWEAEKQALIDVFTRYGVEVVRPRLLTDDEKQAGLASGAGYSNFFVRDPFFTVGSLVIEGSIRFAHRQNEVLPVRHLLTAVTSADTESVYVATPKPNTSLAIEQGPFLEGGDVLIYHQTVFVGYSGLASDLVGIEWLQKLLHHWNYTVVPVRLHPQILHLDCALSFVRDGLMIVCEEAFLDGIPAQLQSWDKIFITLDEASQLYANGLPINEEVYVTDQAFTSLIPQIEAYGMKVEMLDYQISRIFGGSFRCTTQPLLRK